MMTNADQPNEIEVSLKNDTELELTEIDIDSDGLPLEFSVDGVIRNLDSTVMDELQGDELKPIAIRFQRLPHSE